MSEPMELTEQQRDQIVAWFTSHMPTGADAAKAAADAGAELDRVDQALRDAGIEYPLGARGVRDLTSQRDGWTDDLKQELEDTQAELARYQHTPSASSGPMSAHELARELLAGPDLPVQIQRLGEPVEGVSRYPGSVALLAGDDEPVDIPIGF